MRRVLQQPKLGELMVRLGFLTQQQLEGTLAHQRQWGISIGRSAVARGFCSEPQVLHALSKQLNLPVVDLDQQELEASDLLPQQFALKYRAVAVARIGPLQNEILVALAAPARLDTQDAVRAVMGKSRLRFALASDEALERAFARIYGTGHSGGWAGRPAESANDTELVPVVKAPTVTAATPGPTGEILASLGLSPRTTDVLRRAAAAETITPREVVRRVLESWASTRRST